MLRCMLQAAARRGVSAARNPIRCILLRRGSVPPKKPVSPEEKSVVTWRVTCTGDIDEAAMVATFFELGGYWRNGEWFLASNRHPAYLCRCLAANVVSGPYNVRLDVTTSR